MAQPHLRFPILLSISAALVTLLMKSLAYWLTGSIGLLSDAVESLVNLTAAVTAFLCLGYAARPVDPSHTYGHEKIEYFSSGLEGMLILVAAAGIVWYAVDRLIAPQPLAAIGTGTLLALAASLVNLVVAQVLLRAGKQADSIVLEADGQHLMTDVWTSVGVVVGLGLVWLTGAEWLDPVVALGVAVNIVWTAWGLILRSFNGLMDHSLPVDEQRRIRNTIGAELEAGVTFHALRTRQAGAHRFADFHLLVPGDWSVRRAHALAEKIERALEQALAGRLEVTVHIEPIEERASWEDSALLALEEPRAHHPR